MRIPYPILNVFRSEGRSRTYLGRISFNQFQSPSKIRAYTQNLGEGNDISSRIYRREIADLGTVENGTIRLDMDPAENAAELREKELSSNAELETGNDYKSWSHDGLIKRVEQLERELKEKNYSITKQIPPATTATPLAKLKHKVKQKPSKFDGSKYSTRLIALKFSYLGKNFNGFEYHLNHTKPLPTIEEELWKALMKGRLIFPASVEETEINWEGCEYSKCGRTDKGVSAFGQVIGIRVRSNRPLGKPKPADGTAAAARENDSGVASDIEIRAPALDSSTSLPQSTSSPLTSTEVDFEAAINFDPIKDEIPYASILNRILPPTIRILAWCPSPPLDFSARFSCRERQYKYFFTQPAYCPSPLPHHPISSQLSPSESVTQSPQPNSHRGIPDGWLNIEAMRTAAKYFEGTNDFRNFCKIDGGKQISNFDREIFKADIEEVKPGEMGPGFAFRDDFLPPFMAQSHSNGNNLGGVDVNGDANRVETAKVYTFTLHGSAFLWHQVRHMVAVLFLVGQGLENPSIVKTLLDISQTPTRPRYEMASDTPLVLWDCIFPKSGDLERKEALQWLYIGDDVKERKWGGNGALMDDIWKVWRERKIDEAVAGSLMSLVSKQGVYGSGSANVPENDAVSGDTRIAPGKKRKQPSQKVFDGGNQGRLAGNYTPVMKKERLESAEVTNDRYARRKGFAGSKEMREALSGAKRLALEAEGGVE